MVRALPITVALLIAACATRPPAPIETHGGTRPRARGAMLQLQREWQDEHGRIPSDAFLCAHEQLKQLQAESAAIESAAGIGRDAWTWLGPGNIGGRIAALHITPSGTMFAASVGGGLWRSDNSGATWQPVDDFLAVLSTTALITNPVDRNVMYAGTGEGFGNAGAIRGAGVFKSTDGGATWSQLPSTATSDWLSVNSLTISPDGAMLLA